MPSSGQITYAEWTIALLERTLGLLFSPWGVVRWPIGWMRRS